MKFKVGEAVFLKHVDGPCMIVVEADKGQVRTVWFDTNLQMDSNTFPETCLEEGVDDAE